MADDFDDELYNVYNTVKEDSLGNTDIYGDDYKDALTGEEPENQQQKQQQQQQQNSDVNPPHEAQTAPSSATTNHEAYDPSAATNDSTHQSNTDDASKQISQPHQQAYMSYSPQRQQQQQQQQPAQPQQQPMMWGTFPPNMYQQYAAYQRTLQQMANPYQMQMFQQQFRQQQIQRPTASSMAQQQQLQTDEEGNRKPPSVASAANQDEGKMFIGGLNWETTDESLRTYFAQFGEVVDCVVMRDPTTGRSRGFGFLTMADHNTLDVIVDQDHYLDGKRIDPKRAIPREEQDKTEKIFVGGISADVDEEEFHDYFTQFGKVIDATLMTDRESGRPRGFGFITFEDSNGVDEALRHPDLAIKGKPIEVKKAMPKSKQMRQGGYRSGGGGGGPGGTGANAGYMPNTRYAGAANYNTNGSGRGGGGYGGFGAAAPSMYPNMYGYGNYGMAAAAYYGGGRGSSNANGYNMGGNNYYGGRGNNYGDDAAGDYREDDHHDDQDRRDDRRKDRSGTGGGALHASQARSQHHYRPY